MDKKKNGTHYGCPGSCHGQITEEQYNAGKKTCGDEKCERHGKPLEKMQYCQPCGKYYTSNEADKHRNCG